MKGALANGYVDSAEDAATQQRCTDARTRVERTFGEILADVVCVDHLSVEDHFFEELGADSLTIAKFCARVRKRGDLPSVSMRDVYRHPTIRSLAAALADTASRPAQPTVLAPTEK